MCAYFLQENLAQQSQPPNHAVEVRSTFWELSEEHMLRMQWNVKEEASIYKNKKGWQK